MTGISSGSAQSTTHVRTGSRMSAAIHSTCARMMPPRTRVSIAFGAARCDFDLSAGSAVDEDEIPDRRFSSRLLATLLVRDLADHEHVARTRHSRCDEVEDARERASGA